MTVSIDIDLNARSAHVKLGALKAQLKELGDDLDLSIDLDGDLGDTLDDLTDSMDELSESFNADLNETLDRIENLEIGAIGVGDGDGDSGGDTGSDSGDSTLRDLFKAFGRDRDEILGRAGYNPASFPPGGDGSDTSISGGKFHDYNQDGMLFPEIRVPNFDGGSSDDGGSSGGLLSGLTDRNGKSIFSRIGGSLDGGNRGLKSTFKSIIPSMTTWMNLLAMAIPALGAMAVQAGAVAAAMGGVAVAGASLIGLGLIGHGDSMAESFRNAKKELSELGSEVFEKFEPTADLFSGIQAEFFDFAPGEIQRVAESMEGLIAYKQDAFDMFRGLTQFTATFFDGLSNNQGQVSQLSQRFSKLVGSSLIDFFGWLLEAGTKNQDMLVRLGVIIKILGGSMYDLFMMVSRAIMMLKPFFNILQYLAGLLNNKVVSGMFAIIAALYIISSVLGTVIGSVSLLATILGTGMIPILSSMFVKISTWIFQTLAATVVTNGWAAAIANVIAALGVLAAMSVGGLLLAGAGLGLGKMTGVIGAGDDLSTGSGRSSGGDTVINEGDTVNVDLSNADTSTVEKFGDMKGGGGSRGPTGGSYT